MDNEEQMMNVLLRLVPWAEDLEEEGCECFEQEYPGGPAIGLAGSCHNCIARDLLKITRPYEEQAIAWAEQKYERDYYNRD